MTKWDKSANKMNSLDAYFEQWGELGDRFRDQFASLPNLQKEFKNIARVNIGFSKRFEDLQEQRKIFIQGSSSILNAVSNINLNISGSLKYTQEILEPLQKSLSELPKRTQDALRILGTHGWYFDLDMPLTSLEELKQAISKGDIDETEDVLVEYFERKLDHIEDFVISKFSNRQKIIRSAFKAHRRKEYILSIPVLLAQVDGICSEFVGECLFQKKNTNPRTAAYVEEVGKDTFRGALLYPLAHTLPINQSESERKEGFNGLNRHMVLHGESLDYGSKINSLKSISLINYVVQVLSLKD